jgi:hypothetical protein
VSMLVVYWARWADAHGNVGPFSQTCRAGVVGWPVAGPTPHLEGLCAALHQERRPASKGGQFALQLAG